MKKFSVLALAAVVALGVTSCDSKKSTGSVKLTTEIDSVSFMIGQNAGVGTKKQTLANLENSPMKDNIDAYIAGFLKGFENEDDSVYLGKSMQDTETYVNAFFNRSQEEAANKNLAEGQAFLAENKTKSGIITTESGLQYQVITEGKGAKPVSENGVRVHYTGSLIDGTVFDSSLQNPEPVLFASLAGGYIPGIIEGLKLMPVGSKYILWIPADLAYGMQPPSPAIPLNAMLKFEVELFEIVKQ